MATLTGKKIKNTYKDLLQVSNSNSGIDSTLRAISDGEATDSVLQISSSAINISSAGALQYAGTAITSTAAELNILDGVTSSTAELNILDGVTASTAELNILDGVTSTTAELNILDGVTSTAAELNVLDGYTGSVTELNYLDTLHATGVTSTEFDFLDGVTSNIQTQLDSKISATLTQEQVEDFVGGMLDGTETGISVSYDDTDGNIDFVVATQSDNNFTTALLNKLNAIEASADVTDTANVTSAGALMDSEVSNLAFVKGLTKGISDGNVLTANDAVADNDFLRIDGTEVEGRSAAEVRSDLNVEDGATADQTASEIKTLVGNASDSNVFTDADHSKLDGIEASADVTDATNVTAAGALMDSELTSIADVKALDQSVVSGASPTFTTTNFTDASNKRFMTDAQETKLDSVESNATADQTDEEIQDIVGAMLTGNTETGITVTYQDGDGTIDFVVGTLNQDTTGSAATLTTARNIGGVSFDGSANIDLPGVNTAGNQNTSGTAANATLAATVTVSDSTANTNFPVVFHDESNALLDDTGALRYNPSTGTLLVPNLSVSGTTTTVDTVTMEASNAIIFEGATADAHETTLSIVDPTGDRTINLPNVSGTIPVLAAASTTQISSTPEELNILDGKSFLDEDDFASNSATGIASQQSIKAYVDNEITAAGAGDITAVTFQTDSGSGSKASDTGGSADFILQGGTGVDVTNSSTTITVAADVSDFMSNGSNNRIVTATGTDAMNAEANFTIDGTSLQLGDAKILSLGNSDDLQIHHTTNQNYIDINTGNLTFRDDGDNNVFRINKDGGADLLEGDLKIPATSKLYLDGGSDTYIYQQAADVLDFVVGGQQMLTMVEGGTDYVRVADNTYLGAGNSLDLYMYHSSGNSVINNGTGNLTIRNLTDDGDIILQSDDGSGGITAYLTLDGSATAIKVAKNLEMADNVQLRAGAGDDLQIYHDGSNSIINATGTGDLQIYQNTNDKDIVLLSDDGSGGTTPYITLDGSLSINTLNRNTRVPDSVIIGYGASDDLQIYHNGTNSFGADNYTGHLIFQNRADDSDIIFKTDDGSGGTETYLMLDGSDESVRLPADNKKLKLGSGTGMLSLYHNGTDARIDNAVGSLRFFNYANDEDITFNTDDGSGGTTTYLTLDGSATCVNIDQDVKLAATKKLYLDGGGNSYIQEESADNLIFRAAGGNYLRITGSNIVLNDPGASYDVRIEGDTDSNLFFTDGSADRVGIGTNSPSAKLDIENSTAPTLSNDTHAGEAIFLRSGGSAGDGNVQAVLAFGKADGSSRRSGSAIASVQTDSDVDKVGIGFYTSDSSASSQTMDQRMLLDHTGNVGIGTTSPASKLHIRNDSAADQLRLGRVDDDSYLSVGAGANNAVYNMVTGGTIAHQFQEDGDAKMTILTNGNVGIGTTSPDTTLDVTSSGANGIVLNTDTSDSSNSARLFFDGTSTSCIFQEGNDFSFRTGATTASSSGTERFKITTSGVEVVGSVSASGDVIAFASSDKRLKDNLKPIENSLDKVSKLSGYEFDWNDKQETFKGHDVGVIAQEIEEVLPEVVTTRDTGYKAVKYEKIVPLLIEAIKEQQQQINKLEEKLNG